MISVSSIGRIMSPYLFMDILSPIASFIASPSTIPTSSIVWWQSTIRSPVTFNLRSKRPCFAKLFNIWSKKPIPVSTSASPEPSILKNKAISVSLVFLFTVACLISDTAI